MNIAYQSYADVVVGGSISTTNDIDSPATKCEEEKDKTHPSTLGYLEWFIGIIVPSSVKSFPKHDCATGAEEDIWDTLTDEFAFDECCWDNYNNNAEDYECSECTNKESMNGYYKCDDALLPAATDLALPPITPTLKLSKSTLRRIKRYKAALQMDVLNDDMQ